MCGMCLPHCPTYRVFQNEAESPRGRISMIQAYAQGHLKADDTMFKHLDHCLGCMACEAMCPSRVPYGALIDQAKTLIDHKQPWYQRYLLNITAKPGGLSRYHSLIQWLNWSILKQFAHSIISKLSKTASEVLIQAKPRRLNQHYPAKSVPQGKVILFTGCMASVFDSETLESCIQILTFLGFDVEIPSSQSCCGALHQHNGQPQQVSTLIDSNRQLFKALQADSLVYSAMGCGAQLTKHDLGIPITDVTTLILRHQQRFSGNIQPLDDQKAIIHESCSTQNQLNLQDNTHRLLQLIPGLALSYFDSANLCCGAGGGHQLRHADLSSRLVAIKTDELSNHPANYIVSDNMSCSLHYKTRLKSLDISIEVIHPVTLLARQLKC